MVGRHSDRTQGGSVAAVHEVDVGAFLIRTSEQGLQPASECAVCGTPLKGASAGAYKRLRSCLLICCDKPSCIASFVE